MAISFYLFGNDSIRLGERVTESFVISLRNKSKIPSEKMLTAASDNVVYLKVTKEVESVFSPHKSYMNVKWIYLDILQNIHELTGQFVKF